MTPNEHTLLDRIDSPGELKRLSEEELRRCCGNVIRAILDSAVQRDYIDDYQN